MALDVDFRHLLIADFDASRVAVAVDVTAHGQAGAGFGCADERQDDEVADKGLSAPVLRDEREKAVLDLVPFACSWRQMGDRNFKAGFVGQFLKLPFPEAHPCAVAAAGVRGEVEAFGAFPSRSHQRRMLSTAKAAVSPSMPTFTQPWLAAIS